MKKHILCVAETVTLAHLGRLISFTENYLIGEFDISFACPQTFRNLVPIAFRFYPIECLDSKIFLIRLSKGQPVYTESDLQKQIDEDLLMLDFVKPDLIVTDFRLSLQVSARIKHLPLVNICSGHWSPQIDAELPFPNNKLFCFLGSTLAQFIFKYLVPKTIVEQILSNHAKPFNSIREKYNIKTLKDIRDIYIDGDLTLFPDPRGFLSLKYKQDNQLFIGSLLWQPPMAKNEGLPMPKPECAIPQVYLTLGSSGNYDILSAIIGCLEKINCKVWIATTHKVAIKKNSKFIIAPYLPASEVLKYCDLAICNGGSGTAYQALAAGVPVLGITSNLDQAWTMSFFEKHKIGLSLRDWEFSKNKFKQYIARLLEVPLYKKNAAEFAQMQNNIDQTELMQKITKLILPSALHPALRLPASNK